MAEATRKKDLRNGSIYIGDGRTTLSIAGAHQCNGQTPASQWIYHQILQGS